MITYDELMAEVKANPWPAELPSELQYAMFNRVSEHRGFYYPIWFHPPLREVVRVGQTVAVLNCDNSDRVFVATCETLPSKSKAKRVFKATCRRERRDLREAIASLPPEHEEEEWGP